MIWQTPKQLEEARHKPILHIDNASGGFPSLVWLEQTRLLDVFKTIPFTLGEKLFHWDLPGHGRPYADCGSEKLKGCSNGEGHPGGLGYARIYKRSCARKACPTCFEAWASKSAMRPLIRIATGLAGFEKVDKLIYKAKCEKRLESSSVILETIAGYLEREIHFAKRKVSHTIVSPPQDVNWDIHAEYIRCRTKAYEVAKSRGVRGGCCVPHPYRLKCAECGFHPIPDYKKECPKCGCTRFSWYKAPHWHFISVGKVSHKKAGRLYRKDGWIVRDLGVRLSVFWSLQYILSHAGVSRVQTVTWFGELSYNCMGKVPIVGQIRELCPWCGRALMPHVWIRTDRPPPVLEFVKGSPGANDFSFTLGDWGTL